MSDKKTKKTKDNTVEPIRSRKRDPKSLESKVTNYSKNSTGGKIIKAAVTIFAHKKGSILRKGLKRVSKFMMNAAARTGPGRN